MYVARPIDMILAKARKDSKVPFGLGRKEVGGGGEVRRLWDFAGGCKLVGSERSVPGKPCAFGYESRSLSLSPATSKGNLQTSMYNYIAIAAERKEHLV
jgi:hypothetical protein